MLNSQITGWGKCMPPNVLSNHDLEQLVDTTDHWITTRTGIKERRISHVETSEMGAAAAHRALAAAGKKPEDVDLLLVATCTGDSIIPSTASKVQMHLGAQNAAAMDINANCSGFVYGLVTAANMIRGGFDTVLLVGAEKLHHVMDFTDRNTCVLFGDGAGAVILESTDDDDVGLLGSDLGIDGSAGHILSVPEDGAHGARGRRDPASSGVAMEGREVFKRAVTKMGESSVKSLDRAGVDVADVDLMIPHQANARIIDATARSLGLDDSKVFVNIHSYGNTSAATIPVALTEAIEQGRISAGDTLVFAAFGGGLTWGSAVFRWGSRTEPLGVSDVDLPPTGLTTMDLLRPNFEYFGLSEKQQ